MSGGVVPVNFEAKVAGSGPIDDECIFIGNGREEVIGIHFVEILDAKVINGKSECGATGGVAPETWCVGDRSVTVGTKMMA